MPTAKLNNIFLYYEIYGKDHPLLLISGVNSDNASWSGVRGKLAKHFRVITFDNRASGRSDDPGKKFTIRDMADDAIGLLDHLRIKKCHCIGHSMGGYIAQELAINYPERVEKLVLEATAPVSSARNNMLLNDFLNRFEKDRDNEALMRSWAYWSFSPKTFERKSYIAAFVKYASAYPYSQSAEGFKSQIGAVALFDARARIKNIKAGTLVVIGSDDILIYPAESMKLVKGVKGSVLEKIKDAGHCAHVEKPDLFASVVTRFLKK
ncbi:MAG: alpha/beta fold hydrolase [Candidatus Omnitrophica bacterium]|nr:alpha/beta fold hydrolase [Candidatus Omnitrophota bacterium]